ncbi:MAG: LysR substrate-binding domain-containing protein [Azospirillaceae bacterium]|nr:LysR substrate-binding domain-containing protein [Azospirillaceae bacterium]
MLDDINELRTFVRIAAAGSLSAASREMGLALSVVSKRLATLERKTETRLIARNTRRLSLTDEGARFLDRAERILAEVEEAEALLTHGRVEPQGVLRVSAPFALGRAHVSPVCRDLVRAYPKISIDLTLTDRLIDLIDEGIDVVVRIGEPKVLGLMVRKLADNHRVVVAAPDYLERAGTPVVPADLLGHECLHYSAGQLWRLVGPDGQVPEIKVASRLRSDNGEVSHDWTLSGCGLILKSWIDVEQDVRSGRLVHVLPAWRGGPLPVCALFPSRRQVPTRVRAFLDAMVQRLADRSQLATPPSVSSKASG